MERAGVVCYNHHKDAVPWGGKEMERPIDVIALGEALIDFTDSGRSPAGTRLFEQNPGGAPANVACAVAQLGGKAAFVGKVGDDMHGRFLRDTLAEKGVDVSGMILSPEVFTTLAFVALGEGGERSFSFARKPGADTCLAPEEVREELLEKGKVLHVGSLSLTDEPARTATFRAVGLARKLGLTVSYDPNYRASLWKDAETAKVQMRSLLPFCDIVKLSDEETALLTGEEDPERAAERLLALGVKCAAVTLGRDGALVATLEGCRRVEGFPADAVDTTGAGDAFWGAFLDRFTRCGKTADGVTLSEAADFAWTANAAAAVCVSRRGGIPAMPTLEEVREKLREGRA